MGTDPQRQSETRQHTDLRDAVARDLNGWRRYVIAFDGRDGAGKSTIARYLAWQLGMPAIELDTFHAGVPGTYELRYGDLTAVLGSRLDADRPVIVEGLFVLRSLERVELEPDYLIHVARAGNTGSFSLASDFEEYERTYAPLSRSQARFFWGDADDA